MKSKNWNAWNGRDWIIFLTVWLCGEIAATILSRYIEKRMLEQLTSELQPEEPLAA